jgi:hypothetical protein
MNIGRLLEAGGIGAVRNRQNSGSPDFVIDRDGPAACAAVESSSAKAEGGALPRDKGRLARVVDPETDYTEGSSGFQEESAALSGQSGEGARDKRMMC